MPGSTLHRFEHEAMTTTFEVIIAGQEAGYARSAAAMVFSEIDRLDSLLNRYNPGSDVARINALRPGETVRVAADVLECLMLAATVWNDTEGAFDVTAGALVDCRRDPDGTPRTPDAAELEAARRKVGMERLILNPTDFTVGLRGDRPGAVTVDLGGIGKGYALDKVEDILSDWDIVNELVNGGTSTVLAIGTERPEDLPGDGKPGWRVGVGGRWGEAAGLDTILLRDAALSGSGPDLKGEHIVDPRSGRPDRRHEAAWARCPSATVSDALSTAFILMPEEAIRAYCRAHPEVEAFVVPRDSNRGLVSIGESCYIRQ
jgi:thiamine biosynthesis lipoprotein